VREDHSDRFEFQVCRRDKRRLMAGLNHIDADYTRVMSMLAPSHGGRIEPLRHHRNLSRDRRSHDRRIASAKGPWPAPDSAPAPGR